MKNSAPPKPEPPRQIRLVQGDGPVEKADKPSAGGLSSGKSPVTKKGAAKPPDAKKGRR